MNDDKCLRSPVNKRSWYAIQWHDEKTQLGWVDDNKQPFRSLRFLLKVVLDQKKECSCGLHLTQWCFRKRLCGLYLFTRQIRQFTAFFWKCTTILGHQKRLRKTTKKWVLSFSGALHTAACSQETRFSDWKLNLLTLLNLFYKSVIPGAPRSLS